MARDGDGARRRIVFNAETYLALDRLAKDRIQTLQELADEAFRDLLKKHRRPTTLKQMLRESVRSQPANDHQPVRKQRFDFISSRSAFRGPHAWGRGVSARQSAPGHRTPRHVSVLFLGASYHRWRGVETR